MPGEGYTDDKKIDDDRANAQSVKCALPKAWTIVHLLSVGLLQRRGE